MLLRESFFCGIKNLFQIVIIIKYLYTVKMEHCASSKVKYSFFLVISNYSKFGLPLSLKIKKSACLGIKN